MNSFSYEHPRMSKYFSLCDMIIDRIVCEEDAVKFIFSNGFYKVENEQVQLTKTGYVEFRHNCAEEFTCHIIHREASPKGSLLYGSPISLAELADVLSKENREIELFQELYDFNNLLWRGVLLPYNVEGLSDHIVIETSGYAPMIYFWE